jgi:hypothetical protein
MGGCRYPTGISSLSFNATGDLLAIAASYAFEEGPKEYAEDWHPPKKIPFLFWLRHLLSWRLLFGHSNACPNPQPIQIMWLFLLSESMLQSLSRHISHFFCFLTEIAFALRRHPADAIYIRSITDSETKPK